MKRGPFASGRADHPRTDECSEDQAFALRRRPISDPTNDPPAQVSASAKQGVLASLPVRAGLRRNKVLEQAEVPDVGMRWRAQARIGRVC